MTEPSTLIELTLEGVRIIALPDPKEGSSVFVNRLERFTARLEALGIERTGDSTEVNGADEFLEWYLALWYLVADAMIALNPMNSALAVTHTIEFLEMAFQAMIELTPEETKLDTIGKITSLQAEMHHYGATVEERIGDPERLEWLKNVSREAVIAHETGKLDHPELGYSYAMEIDPED